MGACPSPNSATLCGTSNLPGLHCRLAASALALALVTVALTIVALVLTVALALAVLVLAVSGEVLLHVLAVFIWGAHNLPVTRLRALGQKLVRFPVGHTKRNTNTKIQAKRKAQPQRAHERLVNQSERASILCVSGGTVTRYKAGSTCALRRDRWLPGRWVVAACVPDLSDS